MFLSVFFKECNLIICEKGLYLYWFFKVWYIFWNIVFVLFVFWVLVIDFLLMVLLFVLDGLLVSRFVLVWDRGEVLFVFGDVGDELLLEGDEMVVDGWVVVWVIIVLFNKYFMFFVCLNKLLY